LAIIVVELSRNRRETTAIKVTPIKAVMTATKPKIFVEQWASMAAGSAAVGTSAAGLSVRPA
jgi:hypothetical protein